MLENASRTIKAGKILISVLAICVFISMCCGCAKDTDCTYLYKTRTGETVEVGLDVSGTGYKLDAIKRICPFRRVHRYFEAFHQKRCRLGNAKGQRERAPVDKL